MSFIFLTHLFYEGRRVVIETGRFSSEEEAVEAYNRLSKEERDRTLVRSAPPVSKKAPIPSDEVWFM